MSVVPASRAQRIAWYAARINDWTLNAASIGLTGPETASLAALITSAQNALTAAEAARINSLSATVAYYNAEAAMAAKGAGLLAKIRGHAIANDNPNVYVLADIPPPTPPTPAGMPPVPTNVTAQLQNDGSVKLSWKGTLSHGAYFEVWRRFNNDAQYQRLSSIAAKKYVDDEIPGGCEAVFYVVFAKRGTLTSDASEPASVRMGGSFLTVEAGGEEAA